MSNRRTVTIFDLDGTLVQTETLKAQSYAQAAVELSDGAVRAQEVVAAYDGMIGRAREEVAAAMFARFDLGRYAERRMRELGAATALDAFMMLRVRIYESMIEDERLIREQEYPWATALLREVRRHGYPVGVATMSYRKHAALVLERLALIDQVDALITREDVARPKPDPEIYLLAATRLGAEPRDCLVLEDSLPGVLAANAAGTYCLATTNELTRDSIHAAGVLPPERVVDDPARLGTVARALLADLAPAR
jgi:beta-phosphoglucomutase